MGMNIGNYFWKIIANGSFHKEDRRLQSARAFYKSCVNSQNSNTTRDSRHHLIDMYFGGWELIPSLTTNINNTNKQKQNNMNNGLTNLFLPLLRQTGRSPLFSINIAEDIRAVIKCILKFLSHQNSPGQLAFHPDLPKRIEMFVQYLYLVEMALVAHKLSSVNGKARKISLSRQND
ncbi:hypothetical protein Smp_170490 [Schistosoma mansoni]|uniref:hypothetical protein n=1 Tax=Schistosoma mansoni TaxID=6183 RepID=UPI0001A62D57|nr:hypothetical protein Smp_170490 [Schistosoma mansoni]|eukprot:XP_018650344.1 hypothetical protein Smp_170490 [Schistosoma mansoni]